MFEKEAEEYAHTKHCKKCSSHCEKKCILVKDDYETFKQGAEFGYNKANEWHYVKDGLPPIDKLVFILEKNTDEIPIVARRHIFLYGKETDWVWDCRWGSGFQLQQGRVFAWKEIVLPELPKEIE